MSIQKPTAEELRAWDSQLEGEGLGMNRGRNTDKLNYGFDDSDSLVRGWADVKIYTRQKRKQSKTYKPHKPHKWVLVAHCANCKRSFTAKRKDAKFCSSLCRVKSAQSING